MFRRLRFPGLVPALSVTLLLAAAFIAPGIAARGLVVIACYPVAAPTVTGVAPTSGTALGGTSVVITGTCFGGVAGAAGVNFGATNAASYTVDSATQITAVSPAHAVGLVDITVTNGGLTSATSSADQYTFNQPACASAGLSSNKASPQIVGTVITFTATSTACAFPEYQFYLQDPSGAWTLMQAYNGTTWVWNTAGFAAGNYVVNAWVREIGSGRTVDANRLMPFTLGSVPGPLACTNAGLTSDKASPQQVDFTITFTATSATCLNPLYLFYLQDPTGAWTIVRGYGGPVWAWDTSTLASIGNYVVNVWVTNAGSGNPVQTNFLLPFTITNRVCTAAGLTSDKASPQVHGAVITFTATSASCARPQYLFYLKGPGINGTWSIVQGYDGNVWVWDTSGVASIGTYEVNVWVTAVGSPSAVQTNAVMFFTLT